MPFYKYVATNKQGRKESGEMEAPSGSDVANILHDKGLVVVSIDEKLDLDLDSLLSIQIGGVPLAEKVIFVKQLATMLGAGLPLIQALNIMVQQTENKGMRTRLLAVYKSVESGNSLSESFKLEGTIFSDLQINLMQAGEKSGNLNEIMLKIAVDLEKSKNLKSKIIGALIYPIIILGVMIVVFILLIVFMVPSVRDLYADFGVDELPAVTQALVSLSDTLSNPVGIGITVLLIVAAIFGFRYYYSTQGGRRVIDKLILRAPVFGNLNTKIQLSQFTRLLALLLQSGVPIVESLTTISNSMGNSLFQDALIFSAEEVQKGSSLSVPLAKSEIFPVIILKMIATGEETGKLDKICEDMSNYYETEVDELTSNLTKLMEPFILLIVGVGVGFIAVAIYLPLYSLGQYVS